MDMFFELNKFRNSIKQEVLTRPRSQMRQSQLKRKMSSIRNSVHGSLHGSGNNSLHNSAQRQSNTSMPQVLPFHKIKEIQQTLLECNYINDLSVYYVEELVRFASLVMEKVVKVRGHN
ncbi:unnamed protein product [Paramecium sonneborni]|uniref:Uncharacterized protein n=1 Tax=Paramecium sonneborni TaxID=65129 RepID=A0A8S1MHL2_9CILI|nr:unnamed protein product [Paramecium sonneborni]